MKIIFTIIISICLSALSYGQSEIQNPSFEERSRMNKVPDHWDSCKRGGTPDILPGEWEVTTPAAEGDTYLGMITRSDGTWESVGQQLSTPVTVDECHTFSLQLARSADYVNHNLPIKLKVYLGNGNCDRAQLIGDTENISSELWKKYEFNFIPKQQYTHLILEASYGNGIYIYYNGNILIDDLSDIKMCPRA